MKKTKSLHSSLYKYQQAAVKKLRTGSILCGGVGSGKSRTAVAYYRENEFPKDLYIITTAAKRDTLDWERECASFALSNKRSASLGGMLVIVDSWNNIKKYERVDNAFFIFDEQRVVGSGAWVKSFLKITRNNNWILLSATPGDVWMDYVPVFVANGFYKNRTEFMRRHVVFNRFTKYPKVERYTEEKKLRKLRDSITVTMEYQKPTESIYKDVVARYDKDKLETLMKKRWNPYTASPVRDAGELFFTMRKVVNSDPSRIRIVEDLADKHLRIIVFYNFDYELEILRMLALGDRFELAEYNGHKHEPIPKGNRWVYLVQYMSGAEGWNCTETNIVVFYSQNYSYRIMTQAAGRVDRLNTPFEKLYYYTIISDSFIDKAIQRALKNKKNFNEHRLARETYAIIEGE